MWQIGNTTVRSALRLREGLIALEKSGKQGSIRGEEGEKNFRNLLSEYKVVEIGEDETFSAGRKWRSAMEKMGFLYPKLTGKDKFLQDQIGIPDHITPNGKSLIKAKSLSGWHECHLRAMIAYFIDYEDLIKLNNKKKRLSIINSNQPRYPFIYILKILTYLNDFEGDSKISMIEMGLIIQCSDPKTNIEEIVSEIKDYRKKREAASSKKKFDDELIARKVLGRDPSDIESPTILDTYANTSSAGSIIAFNKFHEDFEPGELGVLSSFGAGYSIGSVVLKRV